MELDATTFILELVNFLVLLWLLNRFLFRPVRVALQTRQAHEDAEASALAAQRAAVQVQADELARQETAMSERRLAAEAELAKDMGVLRQQRMDDLQAELDAERDKARARLAQEAARACAGSVQAQRRRAAAFVRDYLERLASEALEARIIEVFIKDLAAQSEQAALALRDGWDVGQDKPPAIDVSTAYEASPAQRERVEASLRSLMGPAARVVWRQDASLLAGICAHLPGHQLEASLRRGLDVFAEAGASA